MNSRLLITLSLLLLLGGGGPPARAQSTAEHQAVVAMYPIMLQAVKERRLDDARPLCQQAIRYEPRDPVHRYNLACIESLAGAPDAAIAALNQAVSLGFTDVNSLRTDEDLAAVRRDARFAAVVQSAARRAGTAPAAAPAGTVRPVGAAPAAATRTAAVAPAAPRPGGAVAQPLVGKVTGNRPVGLFYMQRYWMATRSLEKSTYYFTPDGRVYVDPTGFSAAALAAHRGSHGTYQVAGSTLTVNWSGTQKEISKLEDVKADAFNWDMGMFVAVTPFRSAQQLVGTFEGGNSASTGSGYIAAVATYTFRADGTYSRSGIASSTSVSDGTALKTGGQGQSSGRWRLNGFLLTLTDSQGQTTNAVSFPFAANSADAHPERVFFGGTMFKRQ